MTRHRMIAMLVLTLLGVATVRPALAQVGERAERLVERPLPERV
jgi:hypothetical protein